ncbi:MAG: T9SS type A sorting domain-containing protein, partial [Saprospiraceae bacterium]|nr:T9SS type A sorting domain-containing protein [Saprospiraceae bacterium]
QCIEDVPPCNPSDASATDNCAEVTITCSQGQLVGGECGGTITNTYTATDACGNTATCIQVITIDDTTPPIIVCPANVQVTCIEDVPVADFAGGTVNDNCDDLPSVIHMGDSENGLCPTIITRTYKATDACGNESTCQQIITVQSTGPALQLNCPADVEEDAGQTPAAIQTAWNNWIDSWKNIVAGGCNPTVTYYHNSVLINNLDDLKANPPEACGSFEDTIKAVADDGCSMQMCQAVFNVLASTEGLIVIIPQGTNICLPGPNPPTVDDAILLVPAMASITIDVPDCVGDVEPESSDTIFELSNDGTIYIFRYIVFASVPNTGLSTEAFIDVEIAWDNAAPSFLNVPADITIECDAPLPSVADVTAVDNVDGWVPVTYVQVPGFSSCGGAFYERRWSAADNCGNTATVVQRINLSDDIDPILEVPADAVVDCADAVPDPSYIASDNCSTLDVTFNETRVDHTDCTYTLTRTWTAVDGCGNTTVKSQTIDVIDNTPPVITATNPLLVGVPNGGEITMYACTSPQVAMDDFSATDDCCAVTIETFDDLVASDVCQEFGFFRRWRCGYRATDLAGNISEFIFFVNQVDTTPAEILNLPADLALGCGAAEPAVAQNVIADDDCSLLSATDFSETRMYDPVDSAMYALFRTWSFTDNCGNYSEATQTITFCGFDPNNPPAALGNTVWMDANEDGLQNNGEEGYNDATVYLYESSNSRSGTPVLIDSTLTATANGKAGSFMFHPLEAGTYQLQFMPPPDMILTTYQQGSDASLDSDADPTTGMTSELPVQAGEIVMDIDAGLIQSAVLPVELSRFTGSAEECRITLDWSTASEVGTDRFEVQRSIDGIRFKTLSSVSAEGSPSISMDYTFIDIDPSTENLYRLQIIDLDGSVNYSDVISINRVCDRQGQSVFIYPNPTRYRTAIELSLTEGANVRIQLYDKLGRLILTRQKQFDAGLHTEWLDVTELPNGVYALSIQFDGEIHNKLLMKNH